MMPPPTSCPCGVQSSLPCKGGVAPCVRQSALGGEEGGVAAAVPMREEVRRIDLREAGKQAKVADGCSEHRHSREKFLKGGADIAHATVSLGAVARMEARASRRDKSFVPPTAAVAVYREVRPVNCDVRAFKGQIRKRASEARFISSRRAT